MTSREWNWLALSLVPNLGIQTLKKLLQIFTNVDTLLQTSAAEIVEKSGISEKLATQITHAKEASSYQIEKRLIEQSDINLLCLESPSYPRLLREIPVPPPILYWKGLLPNADAPCIAFVGSRSCTTYGKRHTKRLIFEIAELVPDAIIISGLARGIDTMAHQSALEAGLATIAVLAGGLTKIYPLENQQLSEKIQETGALVTEFPMALKPMPRNFPVRNRIISGLSHGIVITEADYKSGALITTAFGIQHNREVFALPGNVDSRSSRGVNQLIARQHAKLVVSGKCIVDEISCFHPRGLQTEFSFAVPQPTIHLKELSDAETQIVQTLATGIQDLDTLYVETGIEISELMTILLQLEVTGYVNSMEGQCYQLSESFQLIE